MIKRVVERIFGAIGQRTESSETTRVTGYLKQELQLDQIPATMVNRFLRSDAGRTDPMRQVRERTMNALTVYRTLTGQDCPNGRDILPLILYDSQEFPASTLTSDPDVRRRLRSTFASTVADFPPGRRLLFDHVSKTGGSTVSAALSYVFPFHCVSNRMDLLTTLDPSQVAWDEWSRWPIICGHVGRQHHAFIPDLDSRRLCTLIRDPISRTRSVYTWHRFNVRSSHPAYHEPALKAARDLSFSDYIRCDAVQFRFRDKQFEVLSGNPTVAQNRSTTDQATQALAAFDLVGVTDQLPEFFAALLEVMQVKIPMSAEELISRVYRNKSRGSIEVCDEDAAYIRTINPRDTQLYELAQSRVQARSRRSDQAA